MSVSPSIHVSVMPEETLEWLAPQAGQTVFDGTLGGGGHTRLLAERVGMTGQVVSGDQDPVAIERARHELASLPVTLVQANFCDLEHIAAEAGVDKFDGALLDLGLSSDQLADRERGFSYEADGELDLRFNPDEGEPAWRMLEHMSAEEIADIIYHYGEERFSRRIARRIVERRRESPVRTAAELAELVRRCVPRSRGHQIDPATRTFQALRIAVNQELKSLEIALRDLPHWIRPGGRVVIISFHSLEDRIVKQAFRDDARYTVLTKKPLRPSDAEAARNPRSRSAKLRAAMIADDTHSNAR